MRRDVREQGKAARRHVPGRCLAGACAVLGLAASPALAAPSGVGPVTDVSSACAGQNAEVEQAVAPRTTSTRRGSDAAARASPGPSTAARTSPRRSPCPTPASPTTRPSPSRRTGPCTFPICGTSTTTPTRWWRPPSTTGRPSGRPPSSRTSSATGETGTSLPPDGAARCTSPGTTGRALRTCRSSAPRQAAARTVRWTPLRWCRSPRTTARPGGRSPRCSRDSRQAEAMTPPSSSSPTGWSTP